MHGRSTPDARQVAHTTAGGPFDDGSVAHSMTEKAVPIRCWRVLPIRCPFCATFDARSVLHSMHFLNTFLRKSSRDGQELLFNSRCDQAG